jgi:hypothetical protein
MTDKEDITTRLRYPEMQTIDGALALTVKTRDDMLEAAELIEQLREQLNTPVHLRRVI